MNFKSLGLGLSMAALAVGTVVADGGMNPVVGARHAQMDLQAFNLGVLGAMAQGKADFDAASAQAAAANLAALAHLDWTAYWAPGTAAGEAEGSRALPAIWENPDDVGAKVDALRQAADAMVASAGSLDGVKSAMGALGGACGGCHKAYRQAN